MGGCQIRPRLQLYVVRVYAEVGRTWLRSFGSLVLWIFCCTDSTVMLISSLLWGICSSLDSGLLATAVEVSKSCHNSTIKLLIKNPSILFQDNTVISLHCTFQALIFSDRGENANNYLAEWHTHTRRLPYGSRLRPYGITKERSLCFKIEPIKHQGSTTLCMYCRFQHLVCSGHG